MIPFGIAQPLREGAPMGYSSAFQLLFFGLMFVYFLKDSFNGRSLAKRMLQLQVVNHRTGKPATVLQCFIRNIFIIIWPVEVIFTFFQPERRIGDLVAGTRVAYYEPNAVVADEGVLGELIP
jgi:uncharacterized RDD family membrane protein YckC